MSVLLTTEDVPITASTQLVVIIAVVLMDIFFNLTSMIALKVVKYYYYLNMKNSSLY